MSTINYEITCGLTARVPRVHVLSDPLAVAREALAGHGRVAGRRRACATACSAARSPTSTWSSRATSARRARALAARRGRPAFELSEEFGAWRVHRAATAAWQADLSPLRGGSLEADLALRDFTVNAIAEPLDGGEPVDPHGGAGRPRAPGRLRMVVPSGVRRRPAARRARRAAGL